MKHEIPYDDEEYPWSFWQALMAVDKRVGPGPCYVQTLGDGQVGGRLILARERKDE